LRGIYRLHKQCFGNHRVGDGPQIDIAVGADRRGIEEDEIRPRARAHDARVLDRPSLSTMYTTMYKESMMIRKQVYIEPHQERLLKERARQLDVTEAELIRRSLEQGLTGMVPRRPDPAAWRDLMRFFRRRMRMKVRQEPRRWTRDELYDG
jgi:hypothetical protein